MLSPGQEIAGYTLGTALAANRAGRFVFTATSTKTNDHVVIKFGMLPDPPAVGELSREFSLLRQFQKLPVVQPLSYGVLVPERLEYLALSAVGPSLAAMLDAQPNRRMPIEIALLIAHGIAVALDALHDNGWVHADIKPGNLLLPANGGIILADLELAKRIDDLTTMKDVGGTLPFLAPEIWERGGGGISPASDVWALGVVLYICLTGRYPFRSESPEQTMLAVRAGKLPPLEPNTPPVVEALIHRLLSVDVASRPSNGTRAVEAISATMRQLRVGDIGDLTLVLATMIRSCPIYSDLCGPPTLMNLAPGSPPTDFGKIAYMRPERDADEYEEMHSSVSMILPRPAPMQEPSTAVASTVAEPMLRRAAARWYSRMNPNLHFAVSIVISGRESRIVAARGMEVTIGKAEFQIDPDEPIVEIEPCFPGCLISPERLRIDVSPVTQTVRFWVTPLTEGDLDEACVRIFYRGRLVEELPTPTKVVKRTWGYVCIAAGLGWPIFQWVAQRLGWSPMDEINEGFPVVGRLFESIGVTAGSLLIGGVLLAIGGLIYRLTRPIEANQSEVPLLA